MRETKHERKTSKYRSHRLGTVTGCPVGFRYVTTPVSQGTAKRVRNVTGQSLLRSQDSESEGRRNENRYELVSAVKSCIIPTEVTKR